MDIFEIETNGQLLRVRKESFGCTIFSEDQHFEGNETTYEVLRILSEEKDVFRLVERLKEEYQVTEEKIIADLREFFAALQPLGWFVDEYRTIS